MHMQICMSNMRVRMYIQDNRALWCAFLCFYRVMLLLAIVLCRALIPVAGHDLTHVPLPARDRLLFVILLSTSVSA